MAILEHLALRGTFWPSSCAAVIKELQTALATKDTATSLPKQKHTSLDTVLDISNIVMVIGFLIFRRRTLMVTVTVP